MNWEGGRGEVGRLGRERKVKKKVFGGRKCKEEAKQLKITESEVMFALLRVHMCLRILQILSSYDRVCLSSSILFYRFRDAYLTSTQQVLDMLVGYSKPSNMAFLGSNSRAGGSPSTSMDHLSCFYPGMLALGALNELLPETKEMAENLTHTCYFMYNSTFPTHLAPDTFIFNTRSTSTSDVSHSSVSGSFVVVVMHAS